MTDVIQQSIHQRQTTMPAVPQPDVSPEDARKNWVVLIVDDTPDSVTVAKLALKFHGATVHTALNGVEGLEVLQRITPDVVLLDIRMPKMDGWQMYRTMRADPRLQQIPIIAVTALAMSKDHEEITRAGFDGHITKPFEVARLVAEVDKVIRRAR
jgi:CheY-like chemotaxis protein